MGPNEKSEEWGSRHFTFVKKSCSLLSLSSTSSTIPTIWEMSFRPLSPLCQPVGRCPFEPQPLGSLQVVVFPMPKKKFRAPLSFVMWVLDIPFLANSSSSCISPGELMSWCSPYISYQVYEGCLLLLLLLGTKEFPWIYSNGFHNFGQTLLIANMDTNKLRIALQGAKLNGII